MNQIHEGLEPWDWEQPESVELKADPRTGTQDYFSTTAEFRAQQSLHDKEQAKLTAQLEQGYPGIHHQGNQFCGGYLLG